MNTKEFLIQELEQIPETVLEEVLDFVLFLKAKQLQVNLETHLLSEASLKKDWLRPEEDEAWQHL